MNKHIFFLVVLLLSAAIVSAQLNVNSEGKARFAKNVAIGTVLSDSALLNIKSANSDGSRPLYGIKSNIHTVPNTISGPIYGIHATANAFSMSYNYPIYQVVGVFGKAIKNGNVNQFFSAGVAGLANYYNGIGVYGAIGTEYISLPTMSKGAAYAGYFDGSVKVTGTLTATIVSTTSDLRLKESIKHISISDFDNISLLQPVTYKLKKDTTQFVYLDGAKEMEINHYGFVAQEVQKIFPELVYEDGRGYLSINYIELIPLLVGKINQLSEKVEKLSNQESAKNPLYKESIQPSIVAKLYQNNPNPFNQSTVIKYDLPLETSQANLYIYDMTGAQIASYSITDFGSSSITISAGNLKAGMYLYSLIADGQIIDTKQMILTK